MSKEELRAEALYSRRKISISQLARESLLVQENLAAQDEYRRAKLVVCYVSRDYEVQTTGVIVRMLAEGKRVAVPLVDDPSHSLLFFEIHGLDELSPGRFGVLEPGRGSEQVTLSETDLVPSPARGLGRPWAPDWLRQRLLRPGPGACAGLPLPSDSPLNRSTSRPYPRVPQTSPWTWSSPRRGS